MFDLPLVAPDSLSPGSNHTRCSVQEKLRIFNSDTEREQGAGSREQEHVELNWVAGRTEFHRPRPLRSAGRKRRAFAGLTLLRVWSTGRSRSSRVSEKEKQEGEGQVEE
eukprot:346863-Hanusia_phi.AAC.1